MNSFFSTFLFFLLLTQINCTAIQQNISSSIPDYSISANLQDEEQKWILNVPFKIELMMNIIHSENKLNIQINFEDTKDCPSHSFLKIPDNSVQSHGHYVFLIINVDPKTQKVQIPLEFISEASQAEIILPEKKSKVVLDFKPTTAKRNLRVLQRETQTTESTTINSPVGLIVAVGFGAMILIFIFILAVVKNGRNPPPRRTIVAPDRATAANVRELAIVEQAQVDIQNIRAARQKRNFTLAEIEEYFPPATFSDIKLDFEQNSCPICLDPYKSESSCRQLICSHVFHAECIKAWLLKHDKCPLCMTTINAETVEDYIRTRNTLAALPGDEVLDQESPENHKSYIGGREIFT